MKTINLKTPLITCMVIVMGLITLPGMAQTRKLPDGSIVYSDGTRRLPNGTVISGNKRKIDRDDRHTRIDRDDVRRLPATRRYPQRRSTTVYYPTQTRRYPSQGNNGHWLPPGQAKKIYGGSARDYAPGQNRNGRGDGDDDNRGHGHGNHGRGHGHDD